MDESWFLVSGQASNPYNNTGMHLAARGNGSVYPADYVFICLSVYNTGVLYSGYAHKRIKLVFYIRVTHKRVATLT